MCLRSALAQEFMHNTSRVFSQRVNDFQYLVRLEISIRLTLAATELNGCAVETIGNIHDILTDSGKKIMNSIGVAWS